MRGSDTLGQLLDQFEAGMYQPVQLSDSTGKPIAYLVNPDDFRVIDLRRQFRAKNNVEPRPTRGDRKRRQAQREAHAKQMKIEAKRANRQQSNWERRRKLLTRTPTLRPSLRPYG